MKYSLSILGLWIALLGLALFIKPYDVPLDETFQKEISPSKWLERISKNNPDWMQKQLQRIKQENLSLKALETTYLTILDQSMSDQFVRYRIVDNQVYRFGDNGQDTVFEKALKTLTQFVILEDMDFLLSYMDGTPEPYTPNGFYLTKDPNLQAPILSWAKPKDAQHVVLIPDYICLSKAWRDVVKQVIQDETSWEEKSSVAFWRGATSDQNYNLQNYTNKPRYILSALSKSHPDQIEAGFNFVYPSEIQSLFTNEQLIKKVASYKEHLQHRYLPCLDGYMCTYPGFQWRLLSNSVTLKADSNDIQWFYAGLKDRVHYLSTRADLSDLIETMNWAEKNLPLVKKITKNSTQFAENFLLIEGQYDYLYRVLQTYANHQKLDPKIAKKTKTSSEWVCIQQRKKPKLKQKFQLKKFF